MTLAVQKGSILIDQNWLNANRNEKAGLSFPDRFTEYSGKAIGAFRDLQVIKGVANLWDSFNPSPVASKLATSAGVATSALGLVRLPSATQDAVKAITNLSVDDGVSVERKSAVAVKDVTEAVASWVYSTIFITGNASLIGVARFADLASDGADLGISLNDYNKAANCESVATGEAKNAFTHTKNYNMLRIAKAVTSVVSAILAVFLLLTGAQLFSVVAMTALSITSTLLAIRRDLYNDQGDYKVIKFDRPVLV